MVKCKYSDCNLSFHYSEIEEHEENCDKKIITCGDCGEEIKISDMTTHFCIASLTTKITSMLLQYTENARILNDLKDTFSDKLAERNMRVHNGVVCNKCSKESIIGINNICLLCDNYHLC